MDQPLDLTVNKYRLTGPLKKRPSRDCSDLRHSEENNIHKSHDFQSSRHFEADEIHTSHHFCGSLHFEADSIHTSRDFCDSRHSEAGDICTSTPVAKNNGAKNYLISAQTDERVTRLLFQQDLSPIPSCNHGSLDSSGYSSAHSSLTVYETPTVPQTSFTDRPPSVESLNQSIESKNWVRNTSAIRRPWEDGEPAHAYHGTPICRGLTDEFMNLKSVFSGRLGISEGLSDSVLIDNDHSKKSQCSRPLFSFSSGNFIPPVLSLDSLEEHLNPDPQRRMCHKLDVCRNIRFYSTKQTTEVHNNETSAHYPRKRLNPRGVEILKKWYNENISDPYPSYDTVLHLATEGGLTETQVRKWLANKRLRSKNTSGYSSGRYNRKEKIV